MSILSYPGQVANTPPFGSHSYELPIFEPDTLLTAEQLKTMFGFGLSQQQATRAHRLGVGVAAGLLPQLITVNNAPVVRITPGSGITSAGLLLHLEAPLDYTHFVQIPGSWPQRTQYPFFTQPGAMYELLTPAAYAAFSSEDVRAFPLGQGASATIFTLANMVVVLHQEQTTHDPTTCNNLGCEGSSGTFGSKLRAYLVGRSDLGTMMRPREQQLTYIGNNAVPLAMKRMPVPVANSHANRVSSLWTWLRTEAQTFIETLVDVSYDLSELEGFANAYDTIAGWDAKLTALAFPPTEQRTANAQYVYELLRDLYAAYEEFRQALQTPQGLAQPLPPVEAFPAHLMLGPFTAPAGQAPGTFRHVWQPALDFPAGLPRRAEWMFQRIGKLIDSFKPVALTSRNYTATLPSDDTYSSPPFTASTPGSSDSASYAARVDETQQTTSSQYQVDYAYPPTNTATMLPTVPSLKITPDRVRAAGFDQRSLPFYYRQDTTKDVRPYWSYTKAVELKTGAILSYLPPTTNTPGNTSFAATPLDYQVDDHDFFRIEGHLDAPASYVVAQLLGLRTRYSLPFDVVAVRADTLNADGQPLLAPVDGQKLVELQVEFSDVIRQLYDAQSSLVAGGITPAITLPTSTFSAWTTAFIASNSDAFYSTRANLLKALNAAYNERIQTLEGQLSFPGFQAANPGLRHGGGVPRGGTFVVVYRVPNTPPSGGTPGQQIVVGDYYLPYRLSGNGPIVQFALQTADNVTPELFGTRVFRYNPNAINTFVGKPIGGNYRLDSESFDTPSTAFTENDGIGSLNVVTPGLHTIRYKFLGLESPAKIFVLPTRLFFKDTTVNQSTKTVRGWVWVPIIPTNNGIPIDEYGELSYKWYLNGDLLTGAQVQRFTNDQLQTAYASDTALLNAVRSAAVYYDTVTGGTARAITDLTKYVVYEFNTGYVSVGATSYQNRFMARVVGTPVVAEGERTWATSTAVFAAPFETYVYTPA